MGSSHGAAAEVLEMETKKLTRGFTLGWGGCCSIEGVSSIDPYRVAFFQDQILGRGIFGPTLH